MLEVSFSIHENINKYIRDYDSHFLKYKNASLFLHRNDYKIIY
jgi:hypothetical protein